MFRSLVTYRARLARTRGHRYLPVDASLDRRPILQRLGLTERAKTTPFRYGYKENHPSVAPLVLPGPPRPSRRRQHFHDLRHTGNTLAGEAGGSLRELMDRMGHSTTRAALIYQHRTSLRDKMIADEISRRAEAERLRSGTQRARDDSEPS